MQNKKQKTLPEGRSPLELVYPLPILGIRGIQQYRHGKAPRRLGIPGKRPRPQVYPSVSTPSLTHPLPSLGPEK